MKKLTTSILILLFSLQNTLLVYAEETSLANHGEVISASKDISSATSAVALPTNDSEITEAQPLPITQPQTPIALQETINTQEGSQTEILEVNESVEIIPVEEVVEVVETTTPVVDVEENEEIVAEPVETTTEEQKEYKEIIYISELKPKSAYRFSITTNKIKANKSERGIAASEFSTKKAESTSDITPTLEDDGGTLSFSGTCNDTYFVVLLYKNEDDYVENPASYILNKAFECVNNSFHYKISQLPAKLADGKYYLLIGSQGTRGTWTPISSLNEIEINRNESIFEEVRGFEEIPKQTAQPQAQVPPSATPVESPSPNHTTPGPVEEPVAPPQESPSLPSNEPASTTEI